MKVFIIGAGEIGRHLAIEWADSEGKHDVTVIEHDEAVASELGIKLNGEVIHGDGASPQILAEAGVGEAALIFALTSNNNVNLVACKMARDLNSEARTICRVLPELERHNKLYRYAEKFGIDHLFSSERLSAINLAAPILNPESLLVESLAGGRIKLQQVRLGGGVKAAGKTLEELQLEDRVRIGAVTRAGKTEVPGGKYELHQGDIVTLVGDATALEKTSGLFQEDHRKRKQMPKVVIFGGDDYGSSLAQVLQNHCQIRIFEKDESVCAKLVDRFDHTTVLHVDASSVSELREEQIEQSDYFVACTHDDEDNVMACLQAQSLGVENCLTLIHRSEYAAAIEKFGDRFGFRKVTSP
ncbi:MAG: Trk system potassium transporter TrkA, partial [Verrucomicrobiota bacterium]